MLEKTIQQKQKSPSPELPELYRILSELIENPREFFDSLIGNQRGQPDRQGLAPPRPGDISQGHSKPHLTSGNGQVPRNP